MTGAFCLRVGKVRISLGAMLVAAAMLYSDFSFFTAEVLAAAFIHEAGHLAAMKLFGVAVAAVSIFPCGVVISSDSTLLPYKREAVTALAGIFANAATGMAALGIWMLSQDIYTLFFVACSFFFAVVNLIPVKTFDGARALEAVLSHCLGQEKTAGIMDTVYYFAFLLLVLSSLYVLTVTGGNFSLVIVLCCVFICVYGGKTEQ